MAPRKDADAGRNRIGFFLVLGLLAGCMSLPKTARTENPPPAKSNPSALPPTTARSAAPPTPVLAITAPTTAAVRRVPSDERASIVPVALRSPQDTAPTPPATAAIKPESTSPKAPPTTTPPASSNDMDAIRRLCQDAVAAYAQHSCYIARVRRREASPGKTKTPEEVMMVKFREQPWSVHFKWLGEEARGREFLYVKGQHEGKLHILTAAGDIPFAAAGHHLALSPDSALVRAASKHPITNAGVGAMNQRLDRLSRAVADGSNTRVVMKYLGPFRRPEYLDPMECIETIFPPHHEPEIPEGGRRLTFFDPVTKLAVLSVTYDPKGQEFDYYCFDRFQFDVKLDDDDFDPVKLWGPPKSASTGAK